MKNKENRSVQSKPALQDKDNKGTTPKKADSIGPQEYEEDRSMKIRMNEQPLDQSKKTDNNQNS